MRVIHYLFYIFVTIFFIFSCSKQVDVDSSLFGRYLFDVEPNDIISQAIEVSTQNQIVGFFNAKQTCGDVDFYKINFAQRNISYKITITGVPGIDTIITIFDQNQKKLFTVDEFGVGQSERIWDYFPTDDYIYISLQAKTSQNEKIPYYLNFIAKGDNSIGEIEPNNTLETALTVMPDNPTKGLISPKNDVDFYKLMFPQTQSVDFSIGIEPLSNVDIFFTLYDKKNNIEKLINYNSFGVTEYFKYLDSSKGSYYLRVSGVTDKYDKKDPAYSIMVTTLPLTNYDDNLIYYEQEFNDTQNLSTNIFSRTSIIGMIFPDNDVDWYTFDVVKAKNIVNISLSSIRGLDTVIEIYDKKNNLVYTIDENEVDGAENASYSNVNLGRYFMKIYSKKGCSMINYSLFCSIK